MKLLLLYQCTCKVCYNSSNSLQKFYRSINQRVEYFPLLISAVGSIGHAKNLCWFISNKFAHWLAQGIYNIWKDWIFKERAHRCLPNGNYRVLFNIVKEHQRLASLKVHVLHEAFQLLTYSKSLIKSSDIIKGDSVSARTWPRKMSLNAKVMKGTIVSPINILYVP